MSSNHILNDDVNCYFLTTREILNWVCTYSTMQTNDFSKRALMPGSDDGVQCTHVFDEYFIIFAAFSSPKSCSVFLRPCRVQSRPAASNLCQMIAFYS